MPPFPLSSHPSFSFHSLYTFLPSSQVCFDIQWLINEHHKQCFAFALDYGTWQCCHFGQKHAAPLFFFSFFLIFTSKGTPYRLCLSALIVSPFLDGAQTPNRFKKQPIGGEFSTEKSSAPKFSSAARRFGLPSTLFSPINGYIMDSLFMLS